MVVLSRQFPDAGSKENQMILPRAMSHVGITVPNIDAASAWYRDVLGCYVLANPSEANDDGSNFGNVVKDIFSEEFGGLKIAHLSTVDGVGIELFQFVEPKTYVPDNNFDYGRTGIFHICITAASELPRRDNSGNPPRGIATDPYRGLQGYFGRRLSHCK
jgi:catechol 2,3-dioxygenase-like lactoylglutathione lyase family enzyme